jgi:very-short-patch-repair endonuclease
MIDDDFSRHYRLKVVRDVARLLRRRQTTSEHLLWQSLRNRRFQGLKFLRQHPIGPCVVDFYCHEKRVAIEIDGAVHEPTDAVARDRSRQELIESFGIRFFRCQARDVEENIEAVLARLQESLD